MTATRTLTWFVMVASLAALGLLMSRMGAAQPFQSVAQRVSEPVEAALRGATAPLADFVSNVGSYGRLRTENRDLRAENERLQVELARAREAENRSNQLADLLKIGEQMGSDRVTYAAIVAQDPSPLRNVVAINRGTADGVQAGMPVLGKGGALVGTVERARERVAWVRLITDAQSGVNAVIQESRAPALAAGAADRTLHMEFLAQGVVVKPGDTVMTSGLGGSYPAGLLIGRVAKVAGGSPEVFKQVEVEPAVQLASLETVAVLTGFQPTPVGAPGR